MRCRCRCRCRCWCSCAPASRPARVRVKRRGTRTDALPAPGRFPEDNIVLLAPEFLIPAITLYKTTMKRMEALGIKWEGAQSAPTGFVGILFMLQVRNGPGLQEGLRPKTLNA